MIFSSSVFLYCFLPLVLVIYFCTKDKYKNFILLLSSLLFYFYGEPKYIILLAISSLCDYGFSLVIEGFRGRIYAKLALLGTILVNLGMLGYFKYYDFFIDNFNHIFGSTIPLQRIVLPIGISFFTFQTLSYTVDVYYEKTKAQRNLVTFATYVCLFPQLVAGPIVRYTDINQELQKRKHTLERVAQGISRFVIGLSKKVLIANTLGQLCNNALAAQEKSVVLYWLYAVAFTGQIYFDFSGYSDMAIGLGSMFGFTFPENFNYPYIAKSITEFWRRWHMTLGGWFRDYVYIPLGGNRTTKGKWLRNIVIVWSLTGLWHGASWNFVIWGGYFGLLLCIEKVFLEKYLQRLPKWLTHSYVMILVIISFVIFNGESLQAIFMCIKGMFGFGVSSIIGGEGMYYLNSNMGILLLALLGVTPYPKKWYSRCLEHRGLRKIAIIFEPIGLGVLLLICTSYIVDGSFNPFLYFRF